jgi:hypothetical protein
MFRSSDDVSHPFNSIHWKDHSKGEGLETRKTGTVSPEEDEKTQLLSQGLTLLLAARGRVLTLSEQRVGPSLAQIITAYCLLAPVPSDPATDFTACFNLH